MNTKEVANKLVELCRTGQHDQAFSELYADNVTSIEMPGMPNEKVCGKEAVIKKSQEWAANVQEFHGGEVSDAIVAGDHFSVKMHMDITFKDSGRQQMEEVCVYEVKQGQIVNEQFFYSM